MNKEQILARATAIKTAVQDHISAKKVENMERPGVEGNSLPAEGTFDSFKTAGAKIGDDDFRHVRMTVKDCADSISVSNLKIVALRSGKPEYGVIRKVGTLNGKLYLKGKAVNPKFTEYSDFELIAMLEGRKFTAKEVTVKTLPYKAEGWTEEDIKSADFSLDPKKAYEVTLLD